METQVTDEKQYEQIVLEGIKIACIGELGSYALRNLQINSNRDFTGIVKDIISTRLLSREIGKKEEVVTFQEYATWWNHFKSSYFPQWLLNYFPVKYVTKSVTVKFIQFEGYPRLNVKGTEDSIAIFSIDTEESHGESNNGG